MTQKEFDKTYLPKLKKMGFKKIGVPPKHPSNPTTYGLTKKFMGVTLDYEIDFAWMCIDASTKGTWGYTIMSQNTTAKRLNNILAK